MKKNKLLWIYIISALVYFLQGIEGIPGLALFLFLKEKLGFTPEKIMLIGSITGLAWVIKPLWGVLCDNFLSKKKWILLSLLGSIIISFYFGLSPFLPLILLVILMSLASVNTAIRDVATDGIMCVEGKESNSCGNIQAVQWISITIASIIVGLLGGFIAQKFDYKVGYLCLIPFYLIAVIVVLKYKPHKKEDVEPQCAYCKWQLDCSGSDNLICDNYEQIVRNDKPSLLQTILSYKDLFTDKRFLFACLFLFLYKFAPSFGTPLSFIQRDSFHWSAMWMGTLGAIISCFEIIGAIIFYKMCKKINIKKWLYISVFLGAITTLCYLHYTAVSAIVYGICFAVLGMYVHLITMTFLAESTIKGKEATSFALLCSVSNLAAGTASTLTGACLYPMIGLKWLIIISAGTSFLCLPLIKRLKING